jgi:hypothetical protein
VTDVRGPHPPVRSVCSETCVLVPVGFLPSVLNAGL